MKIILVFLLFSLMTFYSCEKESTVIVKDEIEKISPKLDNKSEYSFFDLKNKQDIIVSLVLDNSNITELNLLRYKGDAVSLNDIRNLKYFKKLQKLSLHLSSDKYLYIIEELEGLKELTLSGNIKTINKLPKNLQKLHIYNTQIDDFSFLNNSKIKELLIVGSNSINANSVL